MHPAVLADAGHVRAGGDRRHDGGGAAGRDRQGPRREGVPGRPALLRDGRAAAGADAGPDHERDLAAAVRLDLGPHRPRKDHGHRLHAGRPGHHRAGLLRQQPVRVPDPVGGGVPGLGRGLLAVLGTSRRRLRHQAHRQDLRRALYRQGHRRAVRADRQPDDGSHRHLVHRALHGGGDGPDRGLPGDHGAAAGAEEPRCQCQEPVLEGGGGSRNSGTCLNVDDGAAATPGPGAFRGSKGGLLRKPAFCFSAWQIPPGQGSAVIHLRLCQPIPPDARRFHVPGACSLPIADALCRRLLVRAGPGRRLRGQRHRHLSVPGRGAVGQLRAAERDGGGADRADGVVARLPVGQPALAFVAGYVFRHGDAEQRGPGAAVSRHRARQQGPVAGSRGLPGRPGQPRAQRRPECGLAAGADRCPAGCLAAAAARGAAGAGNAAADARGARAVAPGAAGAGGGQPDGGQPAPAEPLVRAAAGAGAQAADGAGAAAAQHPGAPARRRRCAGRLQRPGPPDPRVAPARGADSGRVCAPRAVTAGGVFRAASGRCAGLLPLSGAPAAQATHVPNVQDSVPARPHAGGLNGGNHERCRLAAGARLHHLYGWHHRLRRLRRPACRHGRVRHAVRAAGP
ncbi:putative PE-PGRS family protein [Cupriavidus taiwanensis]|uniref:PE-PGRS family protein n=1 Tax=Cupriavidus taiwanensis TaxID=164546 RepID=A0A375CAQ9_9BURK|nr:putative PE-PGRS family protein [Cupriavidus taiwanensis]